MKKMFLMFLMVGALALPSVQAQVASNKTVTRNVRVSTLNNQKAQCPDGTTQTGLGDDYIICSGPAGPQGPVGPAGPQGVAGPTGAKGNTGAQGPAGPVGPVGATGPAGPVGPVGATGAAGPVGPVGATGAAGPVGPVGPVGATGAVGPQGASCSSENPACRGPQGPAGPAGVSVTGPAGPVGPQGIQGVQGPVGVVPVNPIQWIGWNVFNGGTVTDLVKQDLTVAELVNCYKQPVGLCGVRHGLETQLIVEVRPEFNPQYGNIVFGLEDAAGNLAAVYHTHSTFGHDGFVNGPVIATPVASFALPNVNHFFLKVDTTNVYYSENGKLWFSVGSVGTLQATSIVLGSYNGGAFIVESVNP